MDFLQNQLTACIKLPPVQDDHFWVVQRVVFLYRFDCNFKQVFLKDG